MRWQFGFGPKSAEEIKLIISLIIAIIFMNISINDNTLLPCFFFFFFCFLLLLLINSFQCFLWTVVSKQINICSFLVGSLNEKTSFKSVSRKDQALFASAML